MYNKSLSMKKVIYFMNGDISEVVVKPLSALISHNSFTIKKSLYYISLVVFGKLYCQLISTFSSQRTERSVIQRDHMTTTKMSEYWLIRCLALKDKESFLTITHALIWEYVNQWQTANIQMNMTVLHVNLIGKPQTLRSS